MNEMRVNGYVASRTMTARITNVAGQFYHVASETFETFGAGSHAASSYAIAMTDVGGGSYRGDFPTAITTRGWYFVEYWDSAITTQAVIHQSIYWSGTAEETTIPGDDATITAMCNDALLLLSGAIETQSITSIDDANDPVAVKCAAQYPKAVGKLLSIVQPHYAMKFDDCGDPLEDDDLPEASDWTYVFSLPDDCHENIVGYQTDAANRKARYNHKVMGSYLLTDVRSDMDGDSAYIYYLFAFSDVTAMSQAFRWAVSCEIAYRLSGALDPKKTLEMRELAIAARDAATIADSWRCQAEEGEYSWISHRGG